MKLQKGAKGYICAKKKREILKTCLEFGVVFALLILGVTETGDRMNVLTIVAILGCLPASKALVELIMIMPHHSIELQKAEEIAEKARHLTIIYDMVFTSEKKIMPVEAIVISDHTVCGYSSNAKVAANEVGQHIKQYLMANKHTKASVKIFDDYATFLSRAEDMSLLADKNNEEKKKNETAISRVILNLSL